MQERCPTGLLPGTPAETDAFGSHERVARSIAEVVQTESGGKAIGLEGGWGAGKSTIVKLISQKLSQTKERTHKIAVFDMWSHQDDPLRRTFLENLITQVREFGWVNKEKWDRRNAELTKRRREDTTRVVPRLTGAGVGFAAGVVAKLGYSAEAARELAYRLYRICDQRNRAQEALGYNSLVQSWPEIARLARQIARPQQGTLLVESEG